jgi:acylphosphatase
VSWLRARVVVSGRVQGVWFRESTRRRAEELGVGGWVRNLPDGRVEALFEGPDDRVRSAIEFLQVGPPLARVQDVAVLEESRGETPHAPDPPRFRIR